MINPKRSHFTKQRRALSARQRQALARQASRCLHKLPSRLPRNAKVAMYFDDFGELPTQPIVDWCIRLGYQVYLPIVNHGRVNHGHLYFARIYRHNLKNLSSYRHSLGMRQINSSDIINVERLDVIFCPLVAIDKQGIRMGMGGGYYDRTLAKSNKLQLPKPLKIAWCYDFQCVERLNAQVWDVAMNGQITPTGLQWF